MDGLPEQYLIVILIFLIFTSAFFSASETAFSTCNKIKLKQLVNKGNKRAEKALALTEDYDKLISGILIGNNFVNICATTIAAILFTNTFINGAELSTVIMTVTVLLFGEITPKTIAKNDPDKWVMVFYAPLKTTLIIMTPIILVFGQWQRLLNAVNPPKTQTYSDEELITIIEEVEKEGTLEKEDSELIQSAIEFKDISLEEIFIPRVDLTAIEASEEIKEFEELFQKVPYSRIPVYKETIDNIIGFVHYRDFYNLKENQKIETILQKPLFLPLTMDASSALREMKKVKVHLAIVCDEYGGTAGMVTMEDIIEELVGDIYDEHDEEIQEIIELGNNHYQIDGGVNMSEVYELFNLIDNDDYDAVTISGWVIEQTERIPYMGQLLCIESFEIKIVDADSKKINKIEISLLEK